MQFFKKKKPEIKFWNWLVGHNSGYSTTTNPSEFIDFYLKACPIFTATKMIADAVSSIDIVLKNKDGDFIYKHEALNLLQNPNPFIDGQLFLQELVSSYILTGNSYINIIGEKKPVELNTINPQDIIVNSDSKDGYAGEYSLISGNYNVVYTRNLVKRFIDQRKNELIHLRSYNPQFSSSNLIGISAFAGCQLEIQQYILSSIHNYSLLQNQARPSGIITYKGNNDLNQGQIDGLKDTIKNKLSGAKNAGEPAFLGGDFNWIQLSESTKDMDFPTLKKSVAEACYSAVKIPLPMISPDNMSFANMDASKYLFYDNAVLPIFKRILKFLSIKLLSRYPNAQDLEFYFDESTIEALESRKYENAKTLSQIGKYTDNEIRSITGFEAISGGDIIYRPANLIESGRDIYTVDNRDQPMGKSEFIRIMQEQKRLDGNKLYNDEYIMLKAQEYYGNRRS
jgi:HK97 family phage portal protein